MAYYQYSYRNKPKQKSSGKGVGILILLVCLSLGGYLLYKKATSGDPLNIPLLEKEKIVWVDPLVSDRIPAKASELDQPDDSFTIGDNANNFHIGIVSDPELAPNKECKTLKEVDFFPVMRFATLEDSISLDLLKNLVIGTIADAEANYELILPLGYENNIFQALSVTPPLSENGGEVSHYQTVETREELFAKLEANPNLIAIIPASWLGPGFKVLEIDGVFPLDQPDMLRSKNYLCSKDLDGEVETKLFSALSEINLPYGTDLGNSEPETSCIPDTIKPENTSTVIQTGVTAMGRNVYHKMLTEDDPAWVAHNIGGFLSSADLTHTSNEVSFLDGCTQVSGTMAFCSDPLFIAALEESGIDIVELTGNHNNDKGRDAATFSIDLYDQAGMQYFGGGRNIEDAAKPLIVEVKGAKIGFLGYNYYDSIVSGNSTPLATTTLPGANRYSPEQVESDIKKLREEDQVDIIIVDFQYQECYCYSEGNTQCYKPEGAPNQVEVFQQAKDWGADIVVGTQAHQPQGFEVGADWAIFYGLGNLYFDQTVYTGTREELIIKHYFHDGKYLTTRVYTAMYDSNFQPEIVTGETKESILTKLFTASGWSL